MIQRKLTVKINNHRRKQYCSFLSKQWNSVVGLEVHAQISSKSKLFSGSSNQFADEINSNVSLFDCAIPGTLPTLNKRCVEAGVLTALALNCRVNAVCMFDRKHYFYADLPAGYQITQQRSPLANDGCLEFEVYTPGIHKHPYSTKVCLKQLQLEQDSGKSLHDTHQSLIDLNRAGIPLMELVFDPDLKDGEEAAALVKELINILQRLGTCSGKMEEGALRVDANVSVHKDGEPLGTRTEVKNIGSVRGVAGAIKYEIARQIKLLEKGNLVVNETRAWDAVNKITLPMRDKEVQQDYRYMPEPNLPPLHLAIGPIKRGCVNVDELRAKLPEMPQATRERLKTERGLRNEHAIILVNEPILLKLFEEAILTVDDSQLVTNLLINELLTIAHKMKIPLEDLKTTGKCIGELALFISNGTINRNCSKLVIEQVLEGNTKQLMEIIIENDWKQINGDQEIREICVQTLSENEKLVKDFKAGKVKVYKAILGAVAKKCNQKINMAKVDKFMKQLLKLK